MLQGRTLLRTRVEYVQPDHVPMAMSEVGIIQQNLKALRVTAIPMKESSQDSTRAVYDVVLLYHDPSPLLEGVMMKDAVMLVMVTTLQIIVILLFYIECFT